MDLDNGEDAAGTREQHQRSARRSAAEVRLRRDLTGMSRAEARRVLVESGVLAQLGLTAAGRRGYGLRQKVSLSLPEDLTAAVRERVGEGGLSGYVADAVRERYERDLLGELVEELLAETGPIPEDLAREADAAWPDAQ